VVAHKDRGSPRSCNPTATTTATITEGLPGGYLSTNESSGNQLHILNNNSAAKTGGEAWKLYEQRLIEKRKVDSSIKLQGSA